ncbi:MAG: MerC domain-containing protein [Woeseiaceae bacterium]
MKTPHLLDKAAVTLSGLCLLHCLAMPVVLAALPFFSEIPTGHLHAELLIIVIPVSVVAFLSGYRRHGNRRVLALGTLGLVILTMGGTYAHSHYGLAADRALTIAGSLILAVTHFRNSRLSRHLANAAH